VDAGPNEPRVYLVIPGIVANNLSNGHIVNDQHSHINAKKPTAHDGHNPRPIILCSFRQVFSVWGVVKILTAVDVEHYSEWHVRHTKNWHDLVIALRYPDAFLPCLCVKSRINLEHLDDYDVIHHIY